MLSVMRFYYELPEKSVETPGLGDENFQNVFGALVTAIKSSAADGRSLKALQALGEASSEAGPLDAKTRRLVTLALAIGAHSEGAPHRGIDRAIDDTAHESIDEIRLRRTTIDKRYFAASLVGKI